MVFYQITTYYLFTNSPFLFIYLSLYLSLSANLDVILGAIIRGCNELQMLDVSGNKLQKKETSILAKYLQATGRLYISIISSPYVRFKSNQIKSKSTLFLTPCFFGIYIDIDILIISASLSNLNLGNTTIPVDAVKVRKALYLSISPLLS